MKRHFLKNNPRINLTDMIKESDDKFKIYKNKSYATKNYYMVSPVTGDLFVCTDGVKTQFDDNNAYWIGDMIASYYDKIKKFKLDFMQVRIIKNLNDNGAVFYLFSDDEREENLLIKQEIRYTDLKMNIKNFLLFDGRKHYLIMPDEY